MSKKKLFVQNNRTPMEHTAFRSRIQSYSSSIKIHAHIHTYRVFIFLFAIRIQWRYINLACVCVWDSDIFNMRAWNSFDYHTSECHCHPIGKNNWNTRVLAAHWTQLNPHTYAHTTIIMMRKYRFSSFSWIAVVNRVSASSNEPNPFSHLYVQHELIAFIYWNKKKRRKFNQILTWNRIFSY